MPKVAKAIKFTKETPLTYTTRLAGQELRIFAVDEVIEISDTGASQGGNYIPCQAAAQLIVNGFAVPVYPDNMPITFRDPLQAAEATVRDIIVGADRSKFNQAG